MKTATSRLSLRSAVTYRVVAPGRFPTVSRPTARLPPITFINNLCMKNFKNFKANNFSLKFLIQRNLRFKWHRKVYPTASSIQVAAGAFFLGLPKIVNRRHIQENEIRFSMNMISKQTEYFTPLIVEVTSPQIEKCAKIENSAV
ncbi:hypothetical protein [Sphingobacterium sp. DR205]|uniref:hypothetical protein n=1 Tax=Sphingobacterium sp. DR205 TaxID=2713573 RepID=UPI0013E4B2AE|nr:hypothetical protein [Sphingobacterium sp. DR205]QIH32692.1 hypothetical protein G6053_07190 [Sphingobacterium sp. DR205]